MVNWAGDLAPATGTHPTTVVESVCPVHIVKTSA